MHSHRAGLFCVILLALAMAAPLHAGSLNKQRIAADAQWLAHIDLQAITASKYFKTAVEENALDLDDEDLKEMKDHFGLDMFKDILDATIYGSGDPHEGDMVIVATASPAVDQAVVKMKEQMPVVEVVIAGQSILKIDDEGHQTFFQVRPGSTDAVRTVVVAHKEESIVKGISVLENKAPTLASVDSTLAKASQPGTGSMVFAAAQGLPWFANHVNGHDHEHASKILSSSDRLAFDFGEDGPDTYAMLLIGARTAEDAKNLGDILNGFLAMGRMAVTHEEDLAQAKSLINSITLTSAGMDIRIHMRHNTDELIKLGKALSELHEHDDDDDDHDEDRDHADHDKDHAHHHGRTKTNPGDDTTHPAPE